MTAKWQRPRLGQEGDDLHLICAEVRKESVLLREDSREYRDVAEQIRAKGASLRAHAAILLNL